MNTYETLYCASKPQGIEERKAYIVGGGIAGLATAAFLVDDAGMPGENITIFEKLFVVGGSLDGIRTPKGYQNRGERELEPNMECLWYLCSKVPSLERSGRSVLDDVVDFNRDEPIHSECRAIVQQGYIVNNIHDFKLPADVNAKMLHLLTSPDTAFGDVTIEEYFGKESKLFEGNFWLCFHTMLAFKPWHSVMELRRYMTRFAPNDYRIEYLEGILHTKYNEYDAIVKPIEVWLAGRGLASYCWRVCFFRFRSRNYWHWHACAARTFRLDCIRSGRSLTVAGRTCAATILEAKAFYATIVVATLIGAILNFSPIDPVKALFWSAVINGVVAVPVMAMTMRMATSKVVMGKFHVRGLLSVVGWMATATMAIAAIGMFAT